MDATTLHDRMSQAAGERSYRELADLTNTHAETVRRYMQGQSPSVEFVAALIRGLGLNAGWLLTGRGPMHAAEMKGEALREADVSELLNAMAETITGLIERVERIELFVQTLETRLRAAAVPQAGHEAMAHSPFVGQRAPQAQAQAHVQAQDRPHVEVVGPPHVTQPHVGPPHGSGPEELRPEGSRPYGV